MKLWHIWMLQPLCQRLWWHRWFVSWFFPLRKPGNKEMSFEVLDFCHLSECPSSEGCFQLEVFEGERLSCCLHSDARSLFYLPSLVFLHLLFDICQDTLQQLYYSSDESTLISSFDFRICDCSQPAFTVLTYFESWRARAAAGHTFWLWWHFGTFWHLLALFDTFWCFWHFLTLLLCWQEQEYKI